MKNFARFAVAALVACAAAGCANKDAQAFDTRYDTIQRIAEVKKADGTTERVFQFVGPTWAEEVDDSQTLSDGRIIYQFTPVPEDVR